MDDNKKAFIKVTKEAKDTTIDSCDFEGDNTHIDNEGENTQMINNKHRLSKDDKESPSSSLKITD